MMNHCGEPSTARERSASDPASMLSPFLLILLFSHSPENERKAVTIMTFLRILVRMPGVRRLWRRFPIGSVSIRVQFDIWSRPEYGYGVFSAAGLARSLKIPEISVIEFGVAGGNGLMGLEDIARKVSTATGTKIHTFGFDSGEGMPEPTDYRDLPYVWRQHDYKMDVELLKGRLTDANLIIGSVNSTVAQFLSQRSLPPIGFVSFDLDYYSSTKAALRIFDGAQHTRLPRVVCYFDDIIWPERACYCEYTGVLLAIREFNAENPHRKICRFPNLRWIRPIAAAWNEQIYVLHDFEHPLYTTNITPDSDKYRQMPLR